MKTADLTRMYRINHGALHQNLNGLTHEDTLVQPESGNCLNWVMAHIVSSRNSILSAVGRERIWSAEDEKRYGRGSAPVRSGADAKNFEAMLRDFDQSQERLLAGLSTLSESDLEKPHAMEMNVGEFLAFLQFHEAYHIGQTGILRRLAGKEGAIR